MSCGEMTLTLFLFAAVCLVHVNSSADYRHGTITGSRANQTCSTEMYGNDTIAYWACVTQYAHQSNWFPSPIAGLFSYEIWNGYDGFWQNGAVLETFTNFVSHTNNTHTRYQSVIKGSWRDLYSLLEAYGPYPSFDDMGWYGISYARIYEVFGDEQFLSTSKDILNWCWQTGWDTSGACYGGFWFDNTFVSKQTITNVQMLLLTAKLYRLTNDTDIKSKMDKIYNYILKNKLVNSTNFLIADGATDNCTSNKAYGLTYNTGVMLAALVDLHKLDKNESHLQLADKMAEALIKYSSDNKTGVLVEFCEPNCTDDALMFKGIFVRYLRILMDALSDKNRRAYYQHWLEIQVKSNIERNMCDRDPISRCNITFKDGPPYYNVSGPVFSPHWRGNFTVGAPMQQTSTLDLFVAAMGEGTRCKGKYCNYDPYYPPPQPLNCQDNPCPTGQDCCEYSPYSSYTCCTKDQKCNKTTGICDDKINDGYFLVPTI